MSTESETVAAIQKWCPIVGVQLFALGFIGDHLLADPLWVLAECIGGALICTAFASMFAPCDELYGNTWQSKVKDSK